MKQNQKRDRYFVNHQIRSESVILIDSDGKSLGQINTRDALKKASDAGLDLVQINQARDCSPTCKILDYSKFKYDLSKQEKEAKKKQRENTVKVKEIKFRPTTGENDLSIKAKQAKDFIAEGHRVKISVIFKGREISHKEIGVQTLRDFVSMVPGLILESDPVLLGKYLSVIGYSR